MVLFAGLTGGYLIAKFAANPEMGVSVEEEAARNTINNEANKMNCVSDECLLVDDLQYPADILPENVIESLNLAISDEYKAQTRYAQTIEKFGFIRPFSMIVRAEEQHISQLKALYDKYGIEIPENTWEGAVQIPESIQEACKVGVVAEIENVNLYKEKLLPTVTEYSDIVSVFTNLMNASQNKHLPAFEKCS